MDPLGMEYVESVMCVTSLGSGADLASSRSDLLCPTHVSRRYYVGIACVGNMLTILKRLDPERFVSIALISKFISGYPLHMTPPVMCNGVDLHS